MTQWSKLAQNACLCAALEASRAFVNQCACLRRAGQSWCTAGRAAESLVPRQCCDMLVGTRADATRCERAESYRSLALGLCLLRDFVFKRSAGAHLTDHCGGRLTAQGGQAFAKSGVQTGPLRKSACG